MYRWGVNLKTLEKITALCEKASFCTCFLTFLSLTFSSLCPCHCTVHLSLSLSPSLSPSVTADLCPLSAGPLLVAPSWRAADRLGRGRRQRQLYWCRKGHTRQAGPVSAAACYPPGCRNHNTHTYARIHTVRITAKPNAGTPASADRCQIGLVRLGPS